MDRSLLMIFAIVAVVGVVGILTILPEQQLSGGVTGRVVDGAQMQGAEQADPCASCTGTPVCAGKASKAVNYPNACAAQCDSARIIYDGFCERIPRVG